MGEDTIETVEKIGYGSDVEELKSINSDDALLASMGKAPELKRVYNFWTCSSLPSLLNLSAKLRKVNTVD